MFAELFGLLARHHMLPIADADVLPPDKAGLRACLQLSASLGRCGLQTPAALRDVQRHRWGALSTTDRRGDAVRAPQGFRGSLHRATVRSHMQGSGDSGTCLAARTCLPLGSHSVWAAMPPPL